MDDWQAVTEAETWLVADASKAVVGKLDRPFRPSRPFRATFPRLAALLGIARQTAVRLPNGLHTLFAWSKPSFGLRAWLCPMPPAIVPKRASPDHRTLLRCFGGVVERFNEPSGNWLLNHNHALTAPDVADDASFMEDYAWAFEECGGIPVDVPLYYPVAWEANGNCVLCSRRDGGLLFSPRTTRTRTWFPTGGVRCTLCTSIVRLLRFGIGSSRSRHSGQNRGTTR